MVSDKVKIIPDCVQITSDEGEMASDLPDIISEAVRTVLPGCEV